MNENSNSTVTLTLTLTFTWQQWTQIASAIGRAQGVLETAAEHSVLLHESCVRAASDLSSAMQLLREGATK